ncbi:hypothetical protein GPECTOR_14g129 [Gonium pectorale]|uniref:Uncharacterized protein n=1 Tax=Gonium pectorale TaxID=33097 RepID=A0A150GLZ9_GONPE|nr:hypothetical protein GPECTOR_14g129 [Gonium pectorale]|eukprot:KXZ50879.1 hypothetical protein GPECTOR_14g129 [Gonium pectorale]
MSGEPGPPHGPLLRALRDSRLAGAAAAALVDAPDLQDPDVRPRLAFNLHHAAKDAAQALFHLHISREALAQAAAGAGAGAPAPPAPSSQPASAQAQATAAATAAGPELASQAQALVEALGDPDVLRLQEAMLERLFAHAAVGDGGGWWLARMEASRGLLALQDPLIVGQDTPAAAPWLEDDHCNVLYGSLLVWRSGAGAAAAGQPPPQRVAALTARAGEAVLRLCTGSGLGGRGYTPAPQWQLAKTKELMAAFDLQPLAQKLPPAQARALAADCMAATAWGLALVSHALAAEERGEGGVTAVQRPGPPRSNLEMLAQPTDRWWAANQLLKGLLMTMSACGVDDWGKEVRNQVAERLWRADVAGSFDRLLRLAAAAALSSAGCADGPTGTPTPPSLILKTLWALFAGMLLPLTTLQPAAGEAAGRSQQAPAGSWGGDGADRVARLGLLISAAKYGGALVRRYDAQRRAPTASTGDGHGCAKLVIEVGAVVSAVTHGVGGFRSALQERLRPWGLEEAVPSGRLTAGELLAKTAEATAAALPPDAPEAAAAALRAACQLAAHVTVAAAEAAGSKGAADMVVLYNRDLAEVVGECLGEWARLGFYPLFLPGSQLLACHPHRLLALACELLTASAAVPPTKGRIALAEGLVVALVAAAGHEALSCHVYGWLGGRGGGTGALTGCIAPQLRLALPALVRLSPPHAGCALALLRMAESEDPPPPPGTPLGPDDGGGAFRCVSLQMADRLVRPELAPAVVGVWLPCSPRSVAEAVAETTALPLRQRTAAEAMAGLRAAAALRAVMLEPAAVALRQLRACGNPACEAFGGGSEAELKPRKCTGCRSRYETLESLTAEAKAAVAAEVDALLAQRGRDELVELLEFQRCVAAKGVFIAAAALERYLQWMSANHDVELAKGNYLPDIAYDEDSRMFSFM